MRISKLLLVCMCCLLTVSAVWGQAANSQAHRGILGYLDPQTGAFRVLEAPADAELLPALTTFTGTIKLTITVTLKTTALTTISCSATTSVFDNQGTLTPRVFGEIDTVGATGTGSTRTCALSIPYSWALATQSSDTMSTGYSVTGSATSTGGPPIRSSSLDNFDSRKVPLSGVITTLTAAVTL